MLAEVKHEGELSWRCRQLYPLMLPLQDLDLLTAKALILDRATVVGPPIATY